MSYDHLERGSGHKVTKLESFFFGTPCIPQGGLVYFPALTELRIVNQKFTHISGLDSCVGLTQLWICEGQLEVCACVVHVCPVQWIVVHLQQQNRNNIIINQGQN